MLKPEYYSIISKQLDPRDPTPLNIFEIKNYCYYGFSNPILRPKYWKVFFNYFPANRYKTENFLKQRRKSYSEVYALLEASKDDPTVSLIVSDVNRTKMPTGNAKFADSVSLHRKALVNILKAYASTNKSVGYVQGMNLILLPIYYTFATSQDHEDRTHAEEDAFFCFTNLMAESGENFIEDLDLGREGINGKMKRVLEIVKREDPSLHSVMEEKGLAETPFHMKWLMLFFAGDFKMEEILWMWDRFLSDSCRFEIVLYCAASVILIMKGVIVEEEFDQCLEALQNPSLVSVEIIFNMADELRRKQHN